MGTLNTLWDLWNFVVVFLLKNTVKTKENCPKIA